MIDSLGWAYFKLGQLDQAERYLTEAARLEPTQAEIREHLGDLYGRQGEMEKARAAWQEALSRSVESDQQARLKAKMAGRH